MASGTFCETSCPQERCQRRSVSMLMLGSIPHSRRIRRNVTFFHEAQFRQVLSVEGRPVVRYDYHLAHGLLFLS